MSSRWRPLLFAVGWSIASVVLATSVAFIVVFTTSLVGAAPNTALLFSVLAGGTASSCTLLCGGLLGVAGEFDTLQAERGFAGAPAVRAAVVATCCLAVVGYAAALNLSFLSANPTSVRGFLARPALHDLGVVIVAGAVGPFCEEFFFRHWMWSALLPRWGTLAAALLSASLWLALHYPSYGLTGVMQLVPLGVAVSLARYFGRSFLASVVVHAVNNVMVTSAAFIFVLMGIVPRPA